MISFNQYAVDLPRTQYTARRLYLCLVSDNNVADSAKLPSEHKRGQEGAKTPQRAAPPSLVYLNG